jgi:hypothetical protein
MVIWGMSSPLLIVEPGGQAAQAGMGERETVPGSPGPSGATENCRETPPKVAEGLFGPWGV